MIECKGDIVKENKIKILIFLSIMLIFIGVGAVIIFLSKKEENPNDIHNTITENYVYSDVYDINEFQTVYNAMRNYFSTINGNQNNILNLLFDDYIDINEISINNVNNYIEKKFDNSGYSITSIKKYYNSYYSIYFVEGQYTSEALDEILEQVEVQDIIILDIINNTYSVLPILNGMEDFESIVNRYSLNIYDKMISQNENNEIPTGNISEFNEAMMYFSEYINLLTNYCDRAYELLENSTKIKYSNITNFQSVCESYKNEYISPIVKEYKIYFESGKKYINIVDNYSIKYNFLINSVKDYMVNIQI